MSIRFKPPMQHKTSGWYICTLGQNTQYLHSDMVLRDSTANSQEYTGYFTTQQDAMDALVNYVRNHL